MRCLIVGLGTQGKKRWAVAGGDVVAVVDPVAAEADYRSIDDVPRQLYDAGLVCTPDNAKPAILRSLLAKGKHVLVEKPLLGRDEAVLQDLAALARKNGVVCYTAYNHRFEPHVSRLKDIIDSGRLGTLYAARFFYGNGTARDVRQSPWRDDGLGVLADLGSHLLDLARFLLGTVPEPLPLWQGHCFETRTYDHCVFGTEKGTFIFSAGEPTSPADAGSAAEKMNVPFSVEFAVSLLSWRNTFTIDIVGSEGSAHVNGLCKWGPSTLTVRERVLPSGTPAEEVETLRMPDPTWEREYVHFGVLCRSRVATDLSNDIWINNILDGLGGRTARREAA
jgi:scyllo-inositol 2-dehydrogenase (NADP+)